MRYAPFIVMLLLPIVANAAEDQSSWQIHGRVIDEQGNPVEDFEAATYWSSNGRRWEDDGSFYADAAKLIPKNEGELAAYPTALAKRLTAGRFTQNVAGDRSCASVFATDKGKRRGGYVSVEKSARDREVTIKLVPLTRLTGKIFCSKLKRTPDLTFADPHPPGDVSGLLYFTNCGSTKGEFSLLLPAGTYDLRVYSDRPRAHTPKPLERRRRDAPQDMPKYLGGIRIEVPPAPASLDLGILDVVPDGSETLRYAAKFFSKTPPELSFTDARGVPKTLKLADLRGKWVLLDFWGLNCQPCVRDSLPRLAKFYEQHHADRDRFEILAICNTWGEEFKTIEEFDRLAAPIVEKFWQGKQLPFPILIDGNGKTFDDYGIGIVPDALLIDPSGNLVPDGNEATLAKKLKHEES
ncbi:MAG TPA: TlpA disulfide reductase family protein [Pirellulales bacterium]|jgi:thiol-disulfide isomerase/thioredoxin|nr:TlpA disulfide reductase family protein [Pirellulales bacterium]